MTCTHCAAEMPDISEFCPGCGRPVGAPKTLPAADSHEALLATLAYVAVVPAILFLASPALNRSRFVRFHSWQSILFATATAITALVIRLFFGVFSILPAIGLLLAWLCVAVACFGAPVLWLLLTGRASQGQNFQPPLIGGIATPPADC